MKIRINNNSLRLRLSQNEVTAFSTTGKVSSSCQFPSGQLHYCIQMSSLPSMCAELSGTTITVHVPEELARGWDTDMRVGFDGKDKNGLYILVEKDFQCLKPRPEEDETNLFPNPLAGQPDAHC